MKGFIIFLLVSFIICLSIVQDGNQREVKRCCLDVMKFLLNKKTMPKKVFEYLVDMHQSKYLNVHYFSNGLKHDVLEKLRYMIKYELNDQFLAPIDDELFGKKTGVNRVEILKFTIKMLNNELNTNK